MADWKGNFVTISISNIRKVIEPFEIDRYLDTDTMSDIFDQYPPSQGWQIVIEAHDQAGK